MKLNSLFLLVATCVLYACNGRISPKSEVKKYKTVNEIFGESLEIEDRIDGLLNDDEIMDQVYVVRLLKSNKRHLVLLLGSNDDQFELLLNSEKSILNIENEKDPYIELKVENKQIIIVQQKNECLTEHVFDFNAKEKAYYLSKIISKCDSLEERIRTQKEFGFVKLVDFNSEKDY